MSKPKLRFSEFSSEWSELTLGDIVAENIEPIPMPKTGYTRVGLYCHAKGTFQEYIPEGKGLDVDVMYLVHKDNLIVNITFAWEHAIAITKPEDEGKIVSHRFPTYKFNEGHLPEFYRYLILNKRMEYYLMVASPGGAGRNRVLNKTEFLKIPVNVPETKEQKKIANAISSIEDVIILIEKEVVLWEEKKKGVMQKFFLQEVRFKKGDGSDYPEWEEFLFIDIVALSKDKYNPKSKEQYKCIELDNIEQGTGQIKGYVNSSEQSSIKNVFRIGDILFGKLRPYLRKYAKPDFDGVCSSEIWVLHPNKDVVCTDFLYYLVASNSFIAASNVSSGTKMPRADWNLVSNMYFEIPSLEEQQKIADCLSSIDEVIQIKKQKLKIWKNIRKGLLQQMFV